MESGKLITTQYGEGTYPIDWLDRDPLGLFDGEPPHKEVTFRIGEKWFTNWAVVDARKYLWCFGDRLTEKPEVVL